ncbi:hypothetical protein N7G274_007744 [Stereocaulon virgatum]|uniref:Zinc finger H2C2-type histone UAS binding domain-containing protein n=1 Tax=Stereocaulon virgatum TaxID=373712 RepID=A0ABR4A0L3_9LECA
MPAMLEDPTVPAIYRTSGAPPYPTPTDPQIPPSIVPRQVTLRDRITIASLLPFSTPTAVPPRLLTYLCNQLNLEIEKGDTYPMMTSMPVSTFGTYWFQNFGAIMLLGEVGSIEKVREMEVRGERWEEVCLGSFYIKPNYPGRSSHICNGVLLGTGAARNRGVGRLMGEGYLEWAPKLGYSYSVFNLVYETNVASCRIWDALGFKRIGRVKACGNLRSHPDELVDAIIYGRDLGPESEDFVSEERVDKIRFYLKNGTYPSGADRAEKSRLRSAATHYKLVPEENGQGEKLMLKDKEVVSDPQRQYEIGRTVHVQGHGGINKTTATIAEKYHWVRIKETVSLVIKNCPDCKDMAAKAPSVRPMGDPNNPGAIAQLRRTLGGNGQPNDPNSMIERLVNYQANPTSVKSNNESMSMSPELNHHQQAPVANMRALQDYNDIPLDPQITGHQSPHPIPHQQFSTPRQLEAYTNTTNTDEGRYADFEMEDSQSQQQQHSHSQSQKPDTRMATERHVREGDDPMAFQDEEGNVHDTAAAAERRKEEEGDGIEGFTPYKYSVM